MMKYLKNYTKQKKYLNLSSAQTTLVVSKDMAATKSLLPMLDNVSNNVMIIVIAKKTKDVILKMGKK